MQFPNIHQIYVNECNANLKHWNGIKNFLKICILHRYSWEEKDEKSGKRKTDTL